MGAGPGAASHASAPPATESVLSWEVESSSWNARFGPRFRAPTVTIALAVGALIAWTPIRTAVVLLALLGCAALTLLIRPIRYEPGAPGYRPPTGTALATTGHEPSIDLRLPRTLYYGGMLFLAQLTLRPLGFTVSDFFFLASLLTTGAACLMHRRAVPLLLPKKMLFGVLLYCIGGLISSLFAISPLASTAIVVRFMYLTIVWFWLGTIVLQRPSHVRAAIRIWVVSAALTGAGAVVQFLIGDVIPGTSIVGGRMTGFSQHVNDLGGITAIALVPAVMLATSMTASIANRLLSYLPVILIVAGLTLSGSVGSMIAATSALLLWLSFSTDRHRLLIMSSVAVMGLIVVSIAQRNAGSQSTLDRFDAVTSSRDDPGATLFSRLDTVAEAWERIRANPFVGAGLDEVSNKVDGTGFQVHNLLLGPWYEAGLLGAVGMAIVLLSLASLARTTVSRSRSKNEWSIALSLYAAFGGLFVLGMGAPLLFQRYGWACAALLIALRAQQRRTSQEHASSRGNESSVITGER